MNLKSLFSLFQRKTLDFLFPPRCVGCNKEGPLLCRKCRAELIYLQPPLCRRCSAPISQGTICRKCRMEECDLDGVYSVFEYGGTIRQAILQLKYHNIRTLADPLSRFLAEYLSEHDLSFDIIIPVPIHRRRLRERGYNQTALLARRLSRMARIPVMEGALIRTRHTPSQAKSDSVEQRRENIRDAFSCVSWNVSDKHILLIDDVCTSGATLNSCAASLKSAGAASVWGLTLAKEI